jgi:general stress protein 26
MNTTQILEAGKLLIEKSKEAFVGSVDQDGYPNIKAMLKIETEGLRTFWFSTNTPALRVQQFKENPKASVYFADVQAYKGIMLLGEMEVLTDYEVRKKMWREGFEIYYPGGIDDPYYCVLKFTAQKARFYYRRPYDTFSIEE